MSNPNQDERSSEWDGAVIRRLGKLRDVAVDTSRLDRMIQAQMARPEKQEWSRMWLRPARAIAASVAILALLGVILLSSSAGPVLASPNQLAQIHEGMIAGHGGMMRVTSIAEANKVLGEEWPHTPALPSMPQNEVMGCCLHSVQNKKMACVLLESEGTPITMAVAQAADMSLPSGKMVTRDGISYAVQSTGNLNMVMTERGGRWVCLMGELPAERLMDFAAKLRF